MTNHKKAQYVDKVFFCVADSVIDVYIKDIYPDTIDLYVFYANDKKCYDTYVPLAKACLFNNCEGFHVVTIFCGCTWNLSSHQAFKVVLKKVTILALYFLRNY